MVVATPAAQLAMTDEQRRSFDEQGFIVLENFFTQPEFERLLAAIDEVAARIQAEKGLTETDPFALRNALAHHEAFLYHYRWLRPTDYITQDPELIRRSSPIRRQLLGELDASGDPLGGDPFWEPASRYWRIKNWEDVPLKQWAEERSGNALQTVERVHV